MEHEDTKIRSFSFSPNNLPFFVSSCLVKIIPTYLYDYIIEREYPFRLNGGSVALVRSIDCRTGALLSVFLPKKTKKLCQLK